VAAGSAVAVPTPLELVSAQTETGHACRPPAPLAAKYPVSCRRCPPRLRANRFERPAIRKISNLGVAVVFGNARLSPLTTASRSLRCPPGKTTALMPAGTAADLPRGPLRRWAHRAGPMLETCFLFLPAIVCGSPQQEAFSSCAWRPENRGEGTIKHAHKLRRNGSQQARTLGFNAVTLRPGTHPRGVKHWVKHESLARIDERPPPSRWSGNTPWQLLA
jgi:hypothetical protein